MPATLEDQHTRANAALAVPRRFEFERDSFDFPNELVWAYAFDAATGATTFTRREPKPAYAHRCFVLTRAARQFLYHARFEPSERPASDDHYRRLVREVISRSPRQASEPEWQVIIPGYASLRQFSQKKELLLKAECGGAWRSYVLRSHWRMIFPISRRHQEVTAAGLAQRIHQGVAPIVHLVRFPALSINHGMILYAAVDTNDGFDFLAYDPNDPGRPSCVSFKRDQRTFFLPANSYWPGGRLNIIEIYRGWFL